MLVRAPERSGRTNDWALRTWQEIPGIFETAGGEEIEEGLLAYYEVDAGRTEQPQERLVRFVADVFSFIRPQGRVLSVGCGFGLNEIILSLLSSGLEIIGVDILDERKSDAKVRTMRTISNRLHANRVSGLLADGGRLPFRNDSFDGVLAIDSLSHADYMRPDHPLRTSQLLLVNEMTRVVRSGGVLGIVENNAMSPRNLMVKGRTSCHPVNPFYLQSRLEYGGNHVIIAPYYDLTGRRDSRAWLVAAVLKRSPPLGILLAPWFMLRALKGTRIPPNSMSQVLPSGP